MPITSCPAAFIRAATTDESTPPDMATTTRRRSRGLPLLGAASAASAEMSSAELMAIVSFSSGSLASNSVSSRRHGRCRLPRMGSLAAVCSGSSRFGPSPRTQGSFGFSAGKSTQQTYSPDPIPQYGRPLRRAAIIVPRILARQLVHTHPQFGTKPRSVMLASLKCRNRGKAQPTTSTYLLRTDLSRKRGSAA